MAANFLGDRRSGTVLVLVEEQPGFGALKTRPYPILGLGVGAALLLLAAVGAACNGSEGEIAGLESANSTLTSTNSSLESQVNRLSYNTASGGGVNLKLMPDPETGEATVGMEEVFSFDRNHVMCRVGTNPVAFVLPTFAMGDLTIAPNRFFMSMTSTTIDSYAVTTEPDGSRKVVMRGGLSCSTEVGQTEVTLGDRNESEHATFRVTAIDGGIGGGDAGDRFEYTVFFDEEESPLNYAIFGPEFTFTGQMIAGEVTIIDPNA